MGDRKNPIMFGPEWLRNMPTESSAGRSNAGSGTRPGAQPTGSEPGGQASNASASLPAGPSTLSSASNNRTSNSTARPSRIRRAKNRYGREELLALYETSGDPPEELKSMDLLYQAREKKPIALLSFEEEVRENAGQRGGTSAGVQSTERFGGARVVGRGPTPYDVRGRARMPFVRHLMVGRGPTPVNTASVRNPGFTAGPEEEPAPPRPWSASNGGGSGTRAGDQAEWSQSKLFRRRPNNLTNWRQTSREENEEWRSNENTGRQHTRSHSDKWDRDWNDSDRRPGLDRPQSWNNNRRTWANNDSQIEENLPEWAIDNTEVTGSFDASGAFHDDTSIQKTPESNYALSRSHTHSGFSRGRRDFEEGSEDWWASEKANKLSPKRFKTGEHKSNEPTASSEPQMNANASGIIKTDAGNQDGNPEKMDDKPQATTGKEPTDQQQVQKMGLGQKFPQTKSFGSTLRHNIGFENNDERGNFQSVMINQNNSLRQQHQNIQHSSDSLYKYLQGLSINSNENQVDSLDNIEDNLLDELMDLTLADDDIQPTNVGQPSPSLQMAQPVEDSQLANLETLKRLQALRKIPDDQNLQMSDAGMVPNVPSQHYQMAGLNAQNMAMNAGMAPGLAPGLTAGMAPGLAPGLAPGFSPGNASGINSNRETPSLPIIGVQNTALNSALGLPNITGAMPMPMEPGSVPPMLQGQQISGMAMHSRSPLGTFQDNENMQNVPLNVANSSLFLDHANPPPSMPTPNVQIPNTNAGNPFPIGMTRHNVDSSLETFYTSMLIQHRSHVQNMELMANTWYYRDPNDVVQGPFSSMDMLGWFNAGFFSPTLMVRRAYEPVMRPLGSYGPIVPFAYNPLDFQQVPTFEPPGANAQDARPNNVDEALWGEAGPSLDYLWAGQPGPNFNREDVVNNLPPFFWNGPNSGTMKLPADIVKEMKTEDQILAQMRAKQNIPPPQQPPPFLSDNAPPATSSSAISSSEDGFNVRATPDLDKLQQLIQSDTHTSTSESKSESEESETKCEKPVKMETPVDPAAAKTQPTQKIPSETKPSKPVKNEPEKPAKTKDVNNVTKTKTKKNKEEKKEDSETKIKEDEVKSEKASVESSPTKSKKEEKLSKKEIEKEKKEWIKEGFTIVKGAEKTNNKENKKKTEEAKVIEEMERKKKEEEKLASEEEKKKKQVEMVTKKQLDQQQRQISESLAKRAPWSVSTQSVANTKAGLTLSEIQRLEREKKLEQIKEQQHMMHLIAQQQAAALAREQEMQANLTWAKNNLANNGVGPSLAEIQAETRRQSAAAAAAATQSIEDVIPLPPLTTNLVPWGNSTNGGGFWDTQPATSKLEKPQELAGPVTKPVKPSEPKSKKKVTIPNPTNATNPANPTNPTNSINTANSTSTKRETSPTSEFEAWCSTVLALWRTKIDVPTFVGFLKDIESPYEVKDYVKCYLGDSKDSSDFARQFLERRSKLLRVGMVTPSDDLCSPAMAINPRTALCDYQEVKGKGKKSKKNKMLKVDARILGFSVTASEDRINVGDIDTA